MQWLMGMGILEKVVPVTEQNPAKSRRGLYRISDPYLAFWHRLVSPLVSAGMIGLSSGTRLWQHRVAPRLDDHMGPVFESVCRSFVKNTDSLPFTPLRVGEWWDASSDNEIDIVAIGPDGDLLLGECRWGTADLRDLRRLQARADLISRELYGVRKVHFGLFSRGGLAEDARAAVGAGQALHFDAAALFRA